MCLLCVASASAVTYGNPYRGAGRNGYVGTGYRATTGSRSAGLSQAPTATMRSTSSAGYGAAYAGTMKAASGVTTMQVQGMYTAASAVRGGVTSADTYAGMYGAARRTPQHPGDAEPCGECIDVNGDGVCDICECDIEACDCDPCRCPIGDGWDVWIMLAVMAISYVLFMRRRVKSE